MFYKLIQLAYLVTAITSLPAMQKLPEEYLIVFGDEKNKVWITEYFSFACPHCISLFQEDFSKIQSEFVDSGKVRFEFHPIPLDINTVQAMICLEKLNSSEKRAFLVAVLGLAEEDSDLNTQLMIKAMALLNKPIPDLNEKNFIMNSGAFNEAFLFLKQDQRVEAIPSVSVDGIFYPEEVPTFEVVRELIQKREKTDE